MMQMVFMWGLLSFSLLFLPDLMEGYSKEKAFTKLFICYYKNTKYFPATQVPSDLCTHIIFASGNVTSEGIKPGSPADAQVYKTLVQLKKINPQLKILLSLQNGFESVVPSNIEIMKKFSENALKFLQANDFDGVDLDWEYPNTSDKSNFQKFIQIFKSEIVKASMLLSLALPNSPFHYGGYDTDTLNKYVDFMTAMTYDMHLYSSRDNVTGYNSPLFTPKGEYSYLSTSAMMNFYLNKNITASKLLLGIPLYGRSWHLANPVKHDLHAPAIDKGLPGPYRHIRGIYLYPDACLSLQQGATAISDDLNKAVYFFFNTTWVSYDNEMTVKEKVLWMKSQNLGGIGVWAMHLDDNEDVCNKGFLPLLHTIKSVL